MASLEPINKWMLDYYIYIRWKRSKWYKNDEKKLNDKYGSLPKEGKIKVFQMKWVSLEDLLSLNIFKCTLIETLRKFNINHIELSIPGSCWFYLHEWLGAWMKWPSEPLPSWEVLCSEYAIVYISHGKAKWLCSFNNISYDYIFISNKSSRPQ